MILHRYVGVALGLLVLVWFLSGIVMLFVRWPEVTEAERAAGLAPLDWARCCDFGPASLDGRALDTAAIESVAGRPVLRIGRAVIDLATGRTPPAFSRRDAEAAVFALTGASARSVVAVERDQWTVTGYFNRERPFWKVETVQGDQIYVSQLTGRVVQATTPAERFWAWLGPIPHWLYPQALRQDVALWTQVVIWTSVAGLFLTLTGLYLGLLAWRPWSDARLSPYRGLMNWHHLTSLFTGVLTLAWVLSGLLSMQPWGLLESGPDDAAERIAGRQATYGELRQAVGAIAADRPQVRQIRVQMFGGELFLLADGRRLDAQGRPAPLPPAELTRAGERLGAARQEMITEADAYHYAHHEEVVLPAWRIVRADGVHHYLDPATGELLRTVDTPARGYRWGHLFLHRLDIVPAGPAWVAVVVFLLLACTAGVGTGVWLGIRRLGYDLSRALRALALKSPRRPT